MIREVVDVVCSSSIARDGEILPVHIYEAVEDTGLREPPVGYPEVSSLL
jgi:hypothetical protein